MEFVDMDVKLMDKNILPQILPKKKKVMSQSESSDSETVDSQDLIASADSYGSSSSQSSTYSGSSSSKSLRATEQIKSFKDILNHLASDVYKINTHTTYIIQQ